MIVVTDIYLPAYSPLNNVLENHYLVNSYLENYYLKKQSLGNKSKDEQVNDTDKELTGAIGLQYLAFNTKNTVDTL